VVASASAQLVDVLFALGSICFTAGAIAAQWSLAAGAAIGVTSFVGSIFFTSAGYLQYSETVNVDHGVASEARDSRWRPASWAPDALGSIAFLISSELAFAEVCRRWVCLRCRTLPWKIVGLRRPGTRYAGLAGCRGEGWTCGAIWNQLKVWS
jgi:hypothetical protein